MNVKNCRKCGRIFNYIAGPAICPACKDQQEAKFREVKKYIQEHGRATIAEVCEVCEVEPGQVRQWIREERLQFSDDSPIKVPCESCGKMIGSGKLCDKCRNDLATGFKNAMPQKEPEVKQKPVQSKEQKMRFFK